MIVYIDESGDLGWKFDLPFRRGGSSKYLTLTHLIIPNQKAHLTKRIIKKLFKKFSLKVGNEYKSYDLSDEQRKFFALKVVDLIHANRDIKIVTITVNKKNVLPHIRADKNKLYNYMIRLALLDEIKTEPEVLFIPDPRQIKLESGNSMVDYLQTELYFEFGSHTRLIQVNIDSKASLNLQFTDFISYITWKFYEYGERDIASIIFPVIKRKTLFFD